ncbi:MAG: DUF695 domain-containing protein [Clostridia bacterium]
MGTVDKWFEYDWRVEGIPALFGVDLSLADCMPYDANPYMFFISCMSKDGAPLTNGQLFSVQRLNKKIQRILPLYAGNIGTPDQQQLYFYGSEPGMLDELTGLCAAQKRIICRAGRLTEPTWQTYFDLLYPDAAKFQTEQNREMLDFYKKKGDAMLAPRRISLHMFFPAEPLLLQFTEQARLSGFAAGKNEYAAESELPYGASLYSICSLKKIDIDKLTTRVIRIAEKYDGKLVHWSCQLVRKKPPLS